MLGLIRFGSRGSRANGGVAAPPGGPDGAPSIACFHCGLPVRNVAADQVEFEGVLRPMCCAACAAAAEFVIGSGLGQAYYRARAGVPE